MKTTEEIKLLRELIDEEIEKLKREQEPQPIDPREEYRLIDKTVDEWCNTDEFTINNGITWEQTQNSHEGFSPDGYIFYRRRVESELIDPGEGYRLLVKDEKVIEGSDEYQLDDGSWTKSYQIFQNSDLTYRRRIKPHAKSGDWVRVTKTGFVGKVITVDEKGMVASLTVRHDSQWLLFEQLNLNDQYEIVTRIVKPWTMQEACAAFGEHGMQITDYSYKGKVTGIFENGLTWEGCHQTYTRLTKSHYTLPNGDPCGVVTFEPKETER